MPITLTAPRVGELSELHAVYIVGPRSPGGHSGSFAHPSFSTHLQIASCESAAVLRSEVGRKTRQSRGCLGDITFYCVETVNRLNSPRQRRCAMQMTGWWHASGPGATLSGLTQRPVRGRQEEAGEGETGVTRNRLGGAPGLRVSLAEGIALEARPWGWE